MAKRPRSVPLLAALAATAVLAVVGATVGRADPTPSLPPVTADQLLGSTLDALSQPFTMSGEVQTTLDVGLPQLPAGMSASGGGPLGAVASLTGTQRFKVWHSPDGVRVAHITDLGEQTVVANRTQAWLWDSSTMSAEHLVYADVTEAMQADGSSSWSGGAHAPGDEQKMGDPTVIAERALASLAPYADVSVAGTARVAGQPVYELTLTPSSPLTLIDRITVAVDAQTRLPLRVQVFAKGVTDPSIESAFTRVSFDAIDPSMFAFTPPAGATVTTPSVPARTGTTGPDAGAPTPPVTETFGTGFDTRVAIRLEQPLPAGAGALLPYTGPLASVMTTEIGGHTWVLFGSVGLDTLRADVASLT